MDACYAAALAFCYCENNEQEAAWGWQGLFWLTYSDCGPSVREVRAETQAGSTGRTLWMMVTNRDA